MDEQLLINILSGVGGFLLNMFGGKAIPLLKALAKQTPTKVDDLAVALAEKAIKAEADCDKDK